MQIMLINLNNPHFGLKKHTSKKKVERKERKMNPMKGRKTRTLHIKEKQTKCRSASHFLLSTTIHVQLNLQLLSLFLNMGQNRIMNHPKPGHWRRHQGHRAGIVIPVAAPLEQPSPYWHSERGPEQRVCVGLDAVHCLSCQAQASR